MDKYNPPPCDFFSYPLFSESYNGIYVPVKVLLIKNPNIPIFNFWFLTQVLLKPTLFATSDHPTRCANNTNSVELSPSISTCSNHSSSYNINIKQTRESYLSLNIPN